VDLSFDATVTDENVVDAISSLAGGADGFAKVDTLDLSFTRVSPTGLAKALEACTHLRELKYRSPVRVWDLPIKSAPSTLAVVHLDPFSTEYCTGWDRKYPNDAKFPSDMIELLRQCHFRSQTHGIVASNADADRLLHAVDFHLKESSSEIIARMTKAGDRLLSVHLQANSAAEGAWGSGPTVKAMEAFPASVIDLNWCCTANGMGEND
jgi:hypothetical protein